MSHREIKSGGILINASALDRTKKYKYDEFGTIIEIDGVIVVEQDNDIVISGSKSSLRRLSDIEKNISVLATQYADGTLFSEVFNTNIVITGDATVEGTFDVTGILGSNFTEKLQDIVGGMVSTNTETGIAVSYNDTTGKLDFSVIDSYVNTTGDTMSGILNMGSQKITALATPTATSDASTKGYVDSQLSSELATIAQYTSWFFSDGTNLSEISDGGSLVINPGTNVSISYNGTSGEYTIGSIDTNDIDYINAATFNAGTGVLTLSGVGNAGATVDLDGRYQPKVVISGTAPISPSEGDLWYDDTADLKLFIYRSGVWIDTVPTSPNYYVTGFAFNSGDGVLTATREGLPNITVDLDGRYLTSEAVTTLSHNGVSNILSYTDENGSVTNIDLSTYIDDTNLSRIVNGTVNGTTGIATFSRDDASTFTVDFSALFDDTNLTRITNGAFDVLSGDLTLIRSDATTATTINLDGRYDNYVSWTLQDGSSNAYTITSNDILHIQGSYGISSLFTGDDILSISVDTSQLDTRYRQVGDDLHVDSVAFNPIDGVLTLGRTGPLADLTVGLDGRYLKTDSYWIMSDGSDSTYTITQNDTLKLLGGYAISSLFTGDDILTVAVDQSVLDTRYRQKSEDIHVTSMTFNSVDGVLSAARNNSTPVSVNLDGRYVPNTATLFTVSDGDGSTYPITFGDTLQISDGYGIISNFTGDDIIDISINTATLDTRYDNYSSWTISDGVNNENISSGDTLTVTGTGSTTASYDAITNTLTIDSIGTVYAAGTGIDINGTSISHGDTSTATDLISSNRTYVTGLTFDAFGHITSYETGVESLSNTNYYPTGLSFDSATGNVTITVTGSADITANLDGRYLTNYTETSTLADVTARGASTITPLTFSDVTVNGNLNVLGATTTVNQTTLTVNDSKIFLADGNPSDAIDVGVIFEYNDGINDQSAGIFRDATDGSFVVMATYTPTVGAVINTQDASYSLGDIKAANFTGNVDWSNLSNVPDPIITVNLTGDVEGSANATMTDLGSATINVSASVPATASITLASLSVTELVVTGSQTINNQSTLTSDDPLFILNSTQVGEPDVGMVGAYNDGTAQYSGIFRDATDNKWKVFDGYTPTLTGSTPSINVSDPSFAYATIVADTFEGNLQWANVLNKPAPQVTVALSGDVTGSASTTLTDLANGTVSISTGVSATANLSISSLSTTNDLVVGGNLTVAGTTTTIYAEEINLADNIILLNSNATGVATQDAGIEIERGSDANVSLIWDETNNRWTVGSQSFSASSFIGNLTGNSTYATTAGKWTTPRTITLGGDLSGYVSIDGSANVVLTATVAPNSVQLGADTTGNYMSGVTAGTGISVSHTPSEASIATISHADTSSIANLTPSTRTYVTGLTFDGYGHVQTITTGTEVNVNTDTNNYITALSFDAADGVLTASRSGLSNVTVDLDGRYLQSYAETDTLQSVTSRGNATSNVIAVGSVLLGTVLHDDVTATVATTTQTPITLYASSAFGAKLVVSARDVVTGAIHMTELLIANTPSVAVATEYGSVYTGASPLATFDVDISGGNVRLLVTDASTNNTQYNISITRM